MVLLQPVMQFVKYIFIRGSPTPLKYRMLKVITIDNVLETITYKETCHVVKMRLPTIDKFGEITSTL